MADCFKNRHNFEIKSDSPGQPENLGRCQRSTTKNKKCGPWLVSKFKNLLNCPFFSSLWRRGHTGS